MSSTRTPRSPANISGGTSDAAPEKMHPLAVAELVTAGIVYQSFVRQRDELAAKLKVVEDEMQKRREQLLTSMIAAGVNTIGNEAIDIQITHKRVYSVTDWNAVYDRIRARGEFDLLHKRLATLAVAERESAGDLPEGIRAVVLNDIKVTPRGTRI